MHDCSNGGLRVERAHCHSIFGLSDYHQERTSPTYSQRKNNPRQLHPHPQKQLCPKCGCPETLARLSVGRNKKRLSSDQWTRLHVRIVHPKWSCDQSNRAWRWRNVNCGCFMGRRARIPWWWRRLIKVCVLMWPPNAKLPRSAPVWIWAGPLSASFCKVYLHVDGQ